MPRGLCTGGCGRRLRGTGVKCRACAAGRPATGRRPPKPIGVLIGELAALLARLKVIVVNGHVSDAERLRGPIETLGLELEHLAVTVMVDRRRDADRQTNA